MMHAANQARLADSDSDSALAEGLEQWSAFLDGELDPDQARRALAEGARHDAVHARLRDYMLVGDALRGLHEPPGGAALTRRVMAALQHEPTLLAPMPQRAARRPVLWLAAAAVGVLTWGLLSVQPTDPPPPVALQTLPTDLDVQPYLAAHQDFAQVVTTPAEMHFTRVSLADLGP